MYLSDDSADYGLFNNSESIKDAGLAPLRIDTLAFYACVVVLQSAGIIHTMPKLMLQPT
jgi:hypothetical protein